MIISHKYKFIFIKTSKTAGTSIEAFLAPHCGPKDVIVPPEGRRSPDPNTVRGQNYHGLWNVLREIRSRRGRRWYLSLYRFLCMRKFTSHMIARLVRERISPEVWNSYFKFCVDRNPWDKTLSHYHMVRARRGGNLTLDEYFREGKHAVNFGRYSDLEGNVIVDRVVKYESLNEELGEIFGQLGIPFDGTLGPRMKGAYRKDRRHYREVLTPEQADRIAHLHAKEIEYHGYTF